jgi:hypothetical protein
VLIATGALIVASAQFIGDPYRVEMRRSSGATPTSTFSINDRSSTLSTNDSTQSLFEGRFQFDPSCILFADKNICSSSKFFLNDTLGTSTQRSECMICL